MKRDGWMMSKWWMGKRNGNGNVGRRYIIVVE